MECSITEYPGEYEGRKILHTVLHQGQVMVIDRVPVEVCPVRGDVLLKPETVRWLARLLKNPTKASTKVPLYEFARGR